jgi:hypothetical protein
MYRYFGLATLGLLIALPRPVPAAPDADEPTPPPSPAEPGDPAEPTNPVQPRVAETSLDHENQIGVAVRFGSGYRAVFPYKKEQTCGELDDSGEPKSVCNSRYPVWLEVSPSFGLTKGLELLADVRIFLESPTFTDATGIFIAPGIKYYADPEDMLKFYLTGQLVFELQDQTDNEDLASFDFGVRSALGMQVDLLRYVGLYVQAGMVFGFTRWFSFLADLSGGIQVRY